MASKAAFKRLSKEYQAIQANPTPYITAKPLEANILEWHYVLRGPPDTPYAGGEYHGKVKFPSDYPYKPPAIQMITPSGRFQTNTNICMSMSNFHPSTWNPAWSVSTILNGMLSFMVEEEVTSGGIRTSNADRKALARKSHAFNLGNKQFCELFPDLCTPEAAPIFDPTKTTETELAETEKLAAAVRRRTAAASQPAENTGSLVAQPAAVAASAAAAANNHATGMSLAALPRKWLILLLLLVYFFISKAVSRVLTA
ncbi:Ubiquitin-conjugating enzyme E2 6 [Coemansia sp. RSA 1694]|nr:Ubiquitin-conjugating enzyme E2 6 [Coemansia sp. RSA 25]KAJ2337353.1 Ubiquitin-conjugating enzyme E2 6 [Coemansia sp. RSA 2681]KAJ2455513.1 Ubiquitin-conjugating enzyme E2 6 [Coemansia sp. RSA 2424]KAJ2495213.1 Ubiquitin-conjugating enzyme E2 6 [Coemansia sp. RSA 2052]KAJ2605961.1 Ubiquitin-conjugating enzyme E2 6 [Coemansia sp. RSA 1694]